MKNSYEAAVVKEPGEDGFLRIETIFAMEVRRESERGSCKPRFGARSNCRTKFPTMRAFHPEELDAFGQVNAVFNAWPYWRELVQSSLARMSMPLLAVPVFRLPRNRTDAGAKQDEGRERRKGHCQSKSA